MYFCSIVFWRIEINEDFEELYLMYRFKCWNDCYSLLKGYLRL